MEDDGVCIWTFPSVQLLTYSQIRAHLLQMLDRKGLSLQDIIQTLRTFYDNVDDEPDPPPPTAVAEERAPSQKEILAALIAALDPSTAPDT